MYRHWIRACAGRLAATFGLSFMLCMGATHAGTPDLGNAEVVEAFVYGAVKVLMQQEHSPSGVVAVMQGGELIFAKGYACSQASTQYSGS